MTEIMNSTFTYCTNSSSDTKTSVTTTIEFWPLGLGLLTVCNLGLIGNILSAIVLARPKMKSTYSILTLGLTLCDTTYLLTKLLRYGFTSLFDTLSVASHYNFYIYPFAGPYLRALTFTAQTGSCYFTVALAIDRYISVCWPIHARTLCTKRRAHIMAAGVVLFSIIYNIPRWMEMRTIRKECLESSYPFGAIVYEMKTAPLRQNPEYKAYYIFWGYFFLINVIPFASLIFFNFKIFQAVRIANKTRKTLTSNQKREISFAMMLLTIVVVYLLSNVDYFVLDVLSYMEISYPKFWDSLGNFLLTVNSAVNFLIYCAFGRKFRQEFKQVLSDTIRWKKYQDTIMNSKLTNNSISGAGSSVAATEMKSGKSLHSSKTTIIKLGSPAPAGQQI